MVIDMQNKIITSIGDGILLVNDIIKGRTSRAVGVNGLAINLFKSDKGIRDAIKRYIPVVDKYVSDSFYKIRYKGYTLKKLTSNSYMLSQEDDKGRDKVIKEFASLDKAVEYMFNLVVFNKNNRTYNKITTLLNYLDKVSSQFNLLLKKVK